MIYTIMIPIPEDNRTANFIMISHIHRPEAALTASLGKLDFDDIPACILSIPD